ncbi:uncharacterized protein LOC136083038 [Hydra vulgaris]|uniref:Uncharacterized protein LOC136083038 n=1 Tax=Hydra vulgaris TaxID=6087 RepID=A0ABM4CA28_HYDVU
MAKRYEIHESVKKLILGHYKGGKGYKTISKIVNIKCTVINLPRKGRPAKTTLCVDREMIRKVEQDRRLSASKLAKYLHTDHGITVNPQTVRNRLKNQGFVGRVAPKKPFLSRMMVWGSFAWSGVGELEFIDVIMTKEDGDPKNTSKLATEWVKKNSIKMLDWVPQSPDLNPIGNLWNLFKIKVADQKSSSL